ncbi:CBS domain-containing protein [Streptomonospora sp. PA3]|uniref:CBS domain-containing protein n=1 Tax=Streptomonospora sp. PA3 TaxID=2607326 RepID=UPI0012DDF95A|nr:CBS domain-containing protein [Streptomonospora sp. PA3]MUL41537.1 CBS domain-containing protein [Streptomonospora sp. PA3]
MLVADVMTAPRAVLAPDTPVRRAARLFVERGAAAAPVLDEDGVLLGIVTEIDLLREGYESDPRASASPVAEPDVPLPERVADVMTSDVVTTAENADVARLVEMMVRNRLRWVPVVRDGRVVGMVGRGDLLRLHCRPDTEVGADLRAALEAGAPYMKPWSAEVHEGVVHLARAGATSKQRRTAANIARTVPGVSRVVFDQS